MKGKEIRKRKRDLALQTFYLKVEELLEELEEKLNPESERLAKAKNVFQPK